MAAGELSTQVRRFPLSRVEEGGPDQTPWEGMGNTVTVSVTKEMMSASS